MLEQESGGLTMAEYQQVTVALLPKQRRFLEREATRQDRTISAQIRHLVNLAASRESKQEAKHAD